MPGTPRSPPRPINAAFRGPPVRAADIGAYEHGAVAPDPFFCTTNDGTITITGYWGPDGVVIIPSSITGLPVTRIGPNAFWFYSGLTSVSIPDSVTSVGDQAFYGCANLTSVTIGIGVTNLGAYAFQDLPQPDCSLFPG